jgi:hypothetical protein
VLDYRKVTYRSSVGDMDIPAYVYQPLDKRGARGHAALIWVHGGVHGNWTETTGRSSARPSSAATSSSRRSTAAAPATAPSTTTPSTTAATRSTTCDRVRLDARQPAARRSRPRRDHGLEPRRLHLAAGRFRDEHPFRPPVAIVPVTNLIFRLSYKGPGYQRSFATQERIAGLPFERREIYKERSPYYQVEKLKCRCSCTSQRTTRTSISRRPSR